MWVNYAHIYYLLVNQSTIIVISRLLLPRTIWAPMGIFCCAIMSTISCVPPTEGGRKVPCPIRSGFTLIKSSVSSLQLGIWSSQRENFQYNSNTEVVECQKWSTYIQILLTSAKCSDSFSPLSLADFKTGTNSFIFPA